MIPELDVLWTGLLTKYWIQVEHLLQKKNLPNSLFHFLEYPTTNETTKQLSISGKQHLGEDSSGKPGWVTIFLLNSLRWYGNEANIDKNGKRERKETESSGTSLYKAVYYSNWKQFCSK